MKVIWSLLVAGFIAVFSTAAMGAVEVAIEYKDQLGQSAEACGQLKELKIESSGNIKLELIGSISSCGPTTSYTVTPGVSGSGGTISPNTLQTVNSGNTIQFTVTPDAGYTASVTGCGGSLFGNIYTTGAITANCTVTASFAAIGTNNFTVSTSSGTGGSLSPTSAYVNSGGSTTFAVTPDAGYTISSVSGCNGNLNGNTYTTGAITSNCTVTASFTASAGNPTTYTVTANAGSGGSISPSSVQVNSGSATTFTVTPGTGYTISSVSGCNGNLNGNTYTTGAVTSNCTVTAGFTQNGSGGGGNTTGGTFLPYLTWTNFTTSAGGVTKYYFTLPAAITDYLTVITYTKDWRTNTDTVVSLNGYLTCSEFPTSTSSTGTGGMWYSFTSTQETITISGSFPAGTTFYVSNCNRSNSASKYQIGYYGS